MPMRMNKSSWVTEKHTIAANSSLSIDVRPKIRSWVATKAIIHNPSDYIITVDFFGVGGQEVPIPAYGGQVEYDETPFRAITINNDTASEVANLYVSYRYDPAEL